MTIRQTVRANDDVAAELRSVVVNYDYAAGRPVGLPEAARDKLAAYRVKGGGSA